MAIRLHVVLPFVFKHFDRPYKCQRMKDGETWLLYWHEHNKQWVTLRKISLWEMEQVYLGKLSEESAQIYDDLHEKNSFSFSVDEQPEKEQPHD